MLKAGRWSVIVRPNDEDKTASGLLLAPDMTRDFAQPGTVVAVGEGRLTDVGPVPADVRPGDTVLFTRYAGEPYRYDGEDLLIVDADLHLLAKVVSDG